MNSQLVKNPLGYWEIKNKPSQQELSKYYAETYYQENKGGYEVNYTQDELVYFSTKIEQRSEILRKYLHTSSTPHLLDVGCGEGYTMAHFQKKGWTVKGFDFSSAGVKSKNPDCLDALITGDIFSLLAAEKITGSTYDVVWLQNVLEHVLDPLGLLILLRSLVKPDGIAVVTVPNDCSITQRELLKLGHIHNCFWICPPEHLIYFDYGSLISISNAAGWEPLEILGDFPVDWFLFNPQSNYIIDRSLGKSAHQAKVQIENMLGRQSMQDVVTFYSALAKIGFGRNITAFLRPTLITKELNE